MSKQDKGMAGGFNQPPLFDLNDGAAPLPAQTTAMTKPARIQYLQQVIAYWEPLIQKGNEKGFAFNRVKQLKEELNRLLTEG